MKKKNAKVRVLLETKKKPLWRKKRYVLFLKAAKQRDE